MTNKNKSAAAENMVVTIEYTLTVDGEVLDSSKEEGALPYLHGHSNIVPGLEKAITGMKAGEKKKVVVDPEGGYGEFDAEAVLLMERDDFPDEIPLNEGIELEMVNEEGEVILATIVDVAGESVRLDTNHPLAGKDLHFDIEVIEVRPATDEELAHGHVHGEHGHHH
jgi:FKBP-type peptidyl-prolyl cis-trans isomerase SlyD